MSARFRPKTRDMRIPTPDIDEETGEATFYPIARVTSWAPFGYEKDPDDELLMQPIPKELLLLEQAKEHLKNGYSLRDVAAWLSTQSGRKISHQGLRARVASDQNKEKEFINAKFILRQLVSAYKKAKRIEAIRTGGKGPNDTIVEEEILEAIRKHGGAYADQTDED